MWIRKLWIYTRLCRYRKNFREELQHEQYCVYTTEVDFAEARFVKASIFHKSLWKKIVLPNKKWQLLSSSFGHLQHSIHNTSFGCNPSQLHNEITIFIFKLKIKHTVRTVNNGKFGNPPGTSAGFPDSPSLMSCFIFNSYCKSNVGKFIGQDRIRNAPLCPVFYLF